MGKSTRPVETNARVPVSTFKQAIPVKKREIGRDPRFSDLSGKLNEGLYEASYSWLGEMRDTEEKKLRQEERRLRTAKRPEVLEKREVIHQELGVYKRERKEKQQKEIERRQKREWRKVEGAKVAKGKKPFFLKKSAKKEEELKIKFDKLKKEGKLDTFLTKARKRQSLKDAAMYPELSTFAAAKPKSY
eukprot:TRINITY_DN10410_c0_g1_i4.p1 TRINITY_DN10410_c0_g1~~TRINITY_DN10410_c0_g1_i4.p1  ORF type:complete len:201 (+),score=67.19 TRINITY_DN10410_c0_g1_i4:39-605(+)